MTIEIIVPRQGWSMEEGTFAGWLKQEGDRIKPGDPLFLLETEKATDEIEAIDAGTLRLAPNAPKTGDIVRVGQVLGYLLSDGESVAPAVEQQGGATASSAASAGAVPAATRQVLAGKRAKTTVSPRARRLAKELGFDWSGLKGTGCTGRIRERDIRAAAAGRGDGRLVPHTKIRRAIAARMLAGTNETAPVTLTTTADATNLVNLRHQFKTDAQDATVPGYTDMLVKLTALALKQHPLLQAQWRDDGLFIPNRCDIAVGVDTEAGLLAPVIRQADQLSLRAVATEAHALIARARAGELSAGDMSAATFTITNLGSFGIDAFTPIINPPQSAVLGIGRIHRQPVAAGDRIVPRDVVTLSLTFDHRVLDGAAAARFLDTLRGFLENPAPRLIS